MQTQAVSNIAPETLEEAGFESEREQEAAGEAGLADLLIGDFVLPFEAVAVLLLAAVIGALALVRPQPPGSEG